MGVTEMPFISGHRFRFRQKNESERFHPLDKSDWKTLKVITFFRITAVGFPMNHFRRRNVINITESNKNMINK